MSGEIEMIEGRRCSQHLWVHLRLQVPELARNRVKQPATATQGWKPAGSMCLRCLTVQVNEDCTPDRRKDELNQ